jgi:hypothetical protein
VLIRSRQLACLLVLLSTLGLAAGASEQPRTGFRGTAIEALLYRHAVANSADAPEETPAPTHRIAATALPAAERTTLHAAWPMPEASAQTAAIHAVQSIPRAA